MKPVSPEDKNLVLQILCDSFDGNGSVNYVVKQDQRRKQRIRVLMEYSYYLCSKFGTIYLSDDKKAAMLLLYPAQQKTTFLTILWDLKLAIRAIGISRVSAIMKREASVKKFHPNIDFIYLWFIGVKSEFQGKGIGSKLLTNLIEHNNAEKRPIYLETSVERNVKLYSKLGFEIFQQLQFNNTLYLMRKV